MLNELEIVRFQSHIYSYLQFHPGINIIRGTSHHGKSVIVRAIQWLLENEPDGIEFLNWCEDIEDGIEVHASFDQGSISRIRNKKFNGYSIPEIDEKFEALRGQVPEEVRLISKMNKSNVRGQDEGYFLLRDSPGNVARILNEKSGLEDIDRVAKITRSLIDEFKSKLKHAQEDLKIKIERKEYLDQVAKHKDTIEEIDSLYHISDQYHEKMRDLNDRVAAILSIDHDIAELEKFLESKASLAEIAKLLDRRLKISSKLTSLRFTVEDIADISILIDNYEKALSYKPDIETIIELYDQRYDILEKWEKIIDVLKNIKDIDFRIKKQEAELQNLMLQATHLEKILASVEMCPTCGSDREYWRHELGE